jgi:hypothetical protein
VTSLRRAAPAALLLLLGAAPPAADLTAAATCTLGQAGTEAAFRALPLLATEDDTEADERGTIYSFGSAELWGAPAKRIRFSDYANPNTGEYSQRYEAAGEGDYAAVRARLLAAHGKAKCDREIGASCELTLAPDAQWTRTLTLAQSEGGLLLTCAFSKSG